jgi:SAM-dependent methyltransferase
MPSSDPQTIPKILSLIRTINPRSILDVGCGNGRYGFLFRESLDWDWGRLLPLDWEARIDAVEIDTSYLTPIHEYVYDNVIRGDWLGVDVRQYDVIFMGDVIEHFREGKWQEALKKANETGEFTIVVAPNWCGSLAQDEWCGHPHEKHWVALSPERVKGRCLFANSKTFISVFDNCGSGLLEAKDVCL